MARASRSSMEAGTGWARSARRGAMRTRRGGTACFRPTPTPLEGQARQPPEPTRRVHRNVGDQGYVLDVVAQHYVLAPCLAAPGHRSIEHDRAHVEPPP